MGHLSQNPTLTTSIPSIEENIEATSVSRGKKQKNKKNSNKLLTYIIDANVSLMFPDIKVIYFLVYSFIQNNASLTRAVFVFLELFSFLDYNN